MTTTPEKPTPIKDDRWLWLAVRRGLLVIVKAIEARYDVRDDREGKAA